MLEMAALMGRFQFLVEGYDDDSADLYAIDEVRRFHRRFHEVRPGWFYFLRHWRRIALDSQIGDCQVLRLAARSAPDACAETPP